MIFKLAEDIPCISGVVVALLAKVRGCVEKEIYLLLSFGGTDFFGAVPGLHLMVGNLVSLIQR